MFPDGHILRQIKCMGQKCAGSGTIGGCREQPREADDGNAPITGFIKLPSVHLAPFFGFALSFVRGNRRASQD